MKIKKIVGIGIAALSFVALTSCDSDNTNGSTKTERFITSSLIDHNIELRQTAFKSDQKVLKLDSSHTTNDTYKSQGIIIQDVDGVSKIYSIIAGSELATLSATDEFDVYESNIGGFVSIKNGNSVKIYSPLAKEVFTFDGELLNVDTNTDELDGIPEQDITIVEITYFEEESIKTKNLWFDENGNEIDNPFSNNYKIGDTFKYESEDDIMSKLIGIDAKYTIYSNGVSFYNKKGKLLGTLSFDELLNSVIIDSKVLVQNKLLLPNDAEVYDYVIDNKKYNLSSKIIDLKDFSRKYIDLDYIIEDYEPIFDKNNKIKYAYVKASEIKEHILDTAPSSYYVDKNFSFDYKAPYDIFDFKKIGTNYFDTTTGVLYNKKLNLINVIEDAEVFGQYLYVNVETNNGREAAMLDSNGKFLTDPKFDEYVESYKENELYLIDHDTKSMYLFKDNVETQITGYSNLERYEDIGCYIGYGAEGIVLLNSSFDALAVLDSSKDAYIELNEIDLDTDTNWEKHSYTIQSENSDDIYYVFYESLKYNKIGFNS